MPPCTLVASALQSLTILPPEATEFLSVFSSHDDIDESGDLLINLCKQIVASQHNLADDLVRHSVFCQYLRMRVTLVQRVFCSIRQKYHKQGKVRRTEKASSHCSFSDNALFQTPNKIRSSSQSATTFGSHRQLTSLDDEAGAKAMIQIGVNTGISLVFALLKQNWALKVTE